MFFGVFCPGNCREIETASGFCLFSCFFPSHHRFAKIIKEELPDIVYHISGSWFVLFFVFLQCPLFEDKIIINPPSPAVAHSFQRHALANMQRFTVKCSQNNSRGINKDKNKQLQQPEEFFPSIRSSLKSLQSPLGAGVRLPDVADLYCHKVVQVVHLCIIFLFKRPPSAAFSRWSVVTKEHHLLDDAWQCRQCSQQPRSHLLSNLFCVCRPMLQDGQRFS